MLSATDMITVTASGGGLGAVMFVAAIFAIVGVFRRR